MQPPSPSRGPIAYMTAMYPKASHTFIQREIAQVEAAGIEVLPCSVRKPNPGELIGPEEKAEYTRTFFVIDAARRNPVRLLAAHARLLVRQPKRYLRGLGLAFRHRPAGLRALLYQMFYFAEAGLVAQHVQDRGARHIHNHFANAACTVTMIAAEMTGLPFSFTIHGPDDFFTPNEIGLTTKIRRAAFVICISHFCRSQCMVFSDPEDWPKLKIMHCGVIPENYAPPGGPRDTKNLIFVGRLSGVKGPLLAVEAVSRLVGNHPDVRLRIVGDGPQRSLVAARIAELKMQDHIEFTGYLSQSEVAVELTRSDILVLPSFAEGVPIVLMEAMASGVAVVTTRIAGIAELVEDGVSGALLHASDLDGLTEKLDQMLCDPKMRFAMGQAGRAKVDAEFTLSKELEKLVALFSKGAN